MAFHPSLKQGLSLLVPPHATAQFGSAEESTQQPLFFWENPAPSSAGLRFALLVGVSPSTVLKYTSERVFYYSIITSTV